MANRRQVLKNARLYLVLDRQVQGYLQLFDIFKQSVMAGVDVVQLRDKVSSTREMLDVCRRLRKGLKGRVLFIVNDRLDVALSCGADGVHVGQEDLPVDVVRKIAGKKMIIGASCQTWQHALTAQRLGADYIGLGSVFKTLTKPQRSPMDLSLLTRVYRHLKIPVFAIGGINLKNVGELRCRGIQRVAVTRSISRAKDVPGAVKRFLEILR